jgi:hypothetical protein
MSLDGFIARPGDDMAWVFDWPDRTSSSTR